ADDRVPALRAQYRRRHAGQNAHAPAGRLSTRPHLQDYVVHAVALCLVTETQQLSVTEHDLPPSPAAAPCCTPTAIPRQLQLVSLIAPPADSAAASARGASIASRRSR